MRKQVFVLILIVWTIFVKDGLAENVILRGQITLQNSGGQPVQGVQISAFGATPTGSNTFGQFELVLAEKKPGDQVTLTLKKDGFEIVNRKELRVVLRADPDELVEFVMCPAGQRDQYARVYYEIAEQNINKRYNEELQRINANYERSLKEKEAALQEKNDDLAELQKQRDAALAQAQELAEKFAEVNLDDASELYKTAFEYFRQGEIEKALAVLDDPKMDAALRQAQEEEQRLEERRKKVKEAIRQSIDNYILKARLCIANFQFVDAETYYQKAIDADPDNLDSIFEFGYYLWDQKQFLKALPFYEKARSLAKDDSDVAATLNNLGILYKNLHQYPEATAALQRALKIYEEFTQTNPSTYLPYVAATLNNLGNLYLNLHQYPEATAAYQRALKLYEELAQTNPQTYLPDVAGTLNNLGVLYKDLHQYPEAIAAVQRALQIREELAQTNPQTYLPDVAMTLNNLGLLYRDQHQYPEATAVYQRALQIREQLAKDNPDMYLSGLAISYGNMAWTLLFVQQFKEAERYAQKGLEADPSQEWINANLALAYLFSGQYAQAEAIYVQFKDKPDKHGTYKDVFLEDLQTLEDAGITHPDVAKIRRVLEEK
jgi:tetratricopeptide (TPR) repeat protein